MLLAAISPAYYNELCKKDIGVQIINYRGYEVSISEGRFIARDTSLDEVMKSKHLCRVLFAIDSVWSTLDNGQINPPNAAGWVANWMAMKESVVDLDQIAGFDGLDCQDTVKAIMAMATLSGLQQPETQERKNADSKKASCCAKLRSAITAAFVAAAMRLACQLDEILSLAT